MNTVPAPRPQRLKVLLVEDNALDAELTQARLERIDGGCDVRVVDNESDFRRELLQEGLHIILADYMLPTFSGPEALTIARELAPDVPFIFVSGVLGEEHAVDMLKRGATDYVLKQRLQRLPSVVQRAAAEAEERRQRIRAERALREYELSFRQLVDALRDYAVIALDHNGVIRSWNQAAETMLGYRADEIIGQPVSRLDPGHIGSDSLAEALAVAREAGSHVCDRWMKRRDDRDFFASVVTTAIRHDNGELSGFSQIIRDTTEARRAADEQQRAKEQAEAANASKDRFLAMLSHELRTPLTPILAATSLLESRTELPDSLREMLPMIRRNVELEAKLIDDLLDLTSITHDKLRLQCKPVDLHATLDEVVAMAHTEGRPKKLKVTAKLGARRQRVNADAGRLQQIVWNLLRNAVKFTPDGGRVELESWNPDERHVAVRVSDTGIGIGPAALPRIFSAFEQASGNITRQFGGLGLGLAIAQALAQKHSGTLTAASDGLGKGAQFVLTLPLLATDDDAADEPASSMQPRSRALNVLLVEDNEDTILAMSTLLSFCGHAVDAATTVKQATQFAEQRHYDLLISDLGLPDGDGTDVVRRFNQHQPNRPSIAVTGYGMDGDVQRCRDAGFTAHLTKPVSFDKLDGMIRSLTVDDRAR